MSDIEININDKLIKLTLGEGEALFEELYIFFKDREETEDREWEKLEGIPILYNTNNFDIFKSKINWFK